MIVVAVLDFGVVPEPGFVPTGTAVPIKRTESAVLALDPGVATRAVFVVVLAEALEIIGVVTRGFDTAAGVDAARAGVTAGDAGVADEIPN